MGSDFKIRQSVFVQFKKKEKEKKSETSKHSEYGEDQSHGFPSKQNTDFPLSKQYD